MTTIGPFESCAQLVVWACCGLAWALSFISDRAVAPAALVAGAAVEVARWLDSRLTVERIP
mgnify:CR=1 FL=1